VLPQRSNYLQPVEGRSRGDRGPDGPSGISGASRSIPKETVAAFKRFVQEGSPPQHGPAKPTDELQAIVRSAWQRETRLCQPQLPTRDTHYFYCLTNGLRSRHENLHRNVIFKGQLGAIALYGARFQPSRKICGAGWKRSPGKAMKRWPFRTTECLQRPHVRLARQRWATIDRNYAQPSPGERAVEREFAGQGSSETHPLLSAADSSRITRFWTSTLKIGALEVVRRLLLRDAIGTGLVVQSRLGINPFKYGLSARPICCIAV